MASQSHLSNTTMNIQQAANFLRIHKETIRRLAADGKLPAAKVGKSWLFLQSDLVTYIRSLYPDSASQGVHQRSIHSWHSTNEVTSIGLLSASMVNEYKEALGLPIASER